MGVSTDAKLFYGYCWSEEGSVFSEDGVDDPIPDDDWVEEILRGRGISDPWDAYPPEDQLLTYDARRKVGDAWCEANRAKLDAWTTAKKAVEAEFGVGVGTHCSDEYPMPYVFAVGSEKLASRGNPERLMPAAMAAGPDWSARLDRFFAEFKIAKPHESPAWWLVSYWG